MQRGDIFTPGSHVHVHGPKVGRDILDKIKRDFKTLANTNVFQSGASAVTQILAEQLPDTAACDSLPKLDSMARRANHYRQRNRPADPTDLKFELISEHMQ